MSKNITISNLPNYGEMQLSAETLSKLLKNNPTTFVNAIAREVFLNYCKINKIPVTVVPNSSLFIINNTKVRVIGQSSSFEDNEIIVFTPSAGYMTELNSVNFLFPVFYNKSKDIASYIGFISTEDYNNKCESFIKGSIIPGFIKPCAFNAFVLRADAIAKDKLNKTYSDFVKKEVKTKKNIPII